MIKTNAFEKITTSFINVLSALIIFLPFYFTIDNFLVKKIIFIFIFLAYNLIFLIFNKNRCLGMIIMKTKYEKEYPKIKHFVYIILYTLSFSSLLFWINFPFDLFLLNIFFIQLPIVIIKKTTLHWYLSGNIITVKR